MRKKVLRMNRVGVQTVVKHASNSVMDMAEILAIEKTVRFLAPFVLLVIKKPLFHLSQLVTDLFIAEIASKLDATTTNYYY